MSSNSSLTGTAGEYYVCAELCNQGYLALLTPKNNPLFDVVATNGNGTKSVSIQVKTRSKENKYGWKFGKSICTDSAIKGLFVVLVNLSNGAPEYYIYGHAELSRRANEVYNQYMAKSKRDNTQHKEVDFRWFDDKDFTDEDKKRKNEWGLITDVLKTI